MLCFTLVGVKVWKSQLIQGQTLKKNSHSHTPNQNLNLVSQRHPSKVFISYPYQKSSYDPQIPVKDAFSKSTAKSTNTGIVVRKQGER